MVEAAGWQVELHGGSIAHAFYDVKGERVTVRLQLKADHGHGSGEVRVVARMEPKG